MYNKHIWLLLSYWTVWPKIIIGWPLPLVWYAIHFLWPYLQVSYSYSHRGNFQHLPWGLKIISLWELSPLKLRSTQLWPITQAWLFLTELSSLIWLFHYKRWFLFNANCFICIFSFNSFNHSISEVQYCSYFIDEKPRNERLKKTWPKSQR